MDKWKKLCTIGILVAVTALAAACGPRPPRPELIQVDVKDGRTYVTLQLNAGYISTGGLQSFHTDYVEVDGTIVEEDWLYFYFSRDGEIRVKMPKSDENHTPIQAKNHIKLSGLLLLNFRKYRFLCSLSKSGVNWQADQIIVEEIEDLDALAITTLKSIYSAQQLYTEKFNSLAGLLELSNASMIDSKIGKAASRGHAKDGYYYNLMVDKESWYCTAIPKAEGATGFRPYRIDQTGVMLYQTGDESWRVLPPNDTGDPRRR